MVDDNVFDIGNNGHDKKDDIAWKTEMQKEAMGVKDKPKASSSSLTLIIELYPNGQLILKGPINNELFVLGILEKAKDIVKNFKPLPIRN